MSESTTSGTATHDAVALQKASQIAADIDADKPIISQTYDTEAIRNDLGLMMNYAISSGIEIPNTIVLSQTPDDATLIDNYNSLRKVIAPTTVQSIRYINSQMIMGGHARKWFEIPIFTKCVAIAAVALVALIVISLSPEVNVENQAKGLLASSGKVLFLNLTFICAASLLGVMFYLLKSFADKIRDYTLIPANAIELNAAILIGVISGFVISELFSYSLDNISNQYIEIQKMTLALLGGFSSDAIFSTLQGIVNKFKKLVTN